MGTILWDQNWDAPEWTQYKKRLARTQDALDILTDLLQLHPKIKGAITNLRPELEMSKNTLFFSGVWLDDDDEKPVLIKLGCSDMDYYWAKVFQTGSSEFSVFPHTYAVDDQLGGEKIRWFVMETIPFGVKGPLSDDEWGCFAQAIAEFQKFASQIKDPKVFPLNLTQFKTFLRWGIEKNAPNNAGILLERLKHDWSWIEKECPPTVQFGDVHLANLRFRTRIIGKHSLVLIDPIPRHGPWVFDPAYCQVIATNEDITLIEKVAHFREELGLPIGDKAKINKMKILMLGWLSVMWWGLAEHRRDDLDWSNQISKYIEDAIELDV